MGCVLFFYLFFCISKFHVLRYNEPILFDAVKSEETYKEIEQKETVK